LEYLDDIIKGCQKEKRKSQEALFKMFADKMFGVCRYYSKDYTEAEDILHDGFMRVFSKIKQFKGTGSFEGWLRKIFVTTALERFRKTNYMFSVEDISAYDSNFNTDDLLGNINAKEIIQLISELSPKYRMVFNLYAIEGYSHSEISEMLNISEGTSKSNLSRARMVLQQKVKERFDHEKIRSGLA
jgi:RNA polymerase sigma factor (sigma-70 family)